MSKRKSLGQIAYEAFCPEARNPTAHTNYPKIGDKVARAVIKAWIRQGEADYEIAMRKHFAWLEKNYACSNKMG